MDILLAFIVGAVLGLAAHYAARDRATRGAAVGPILGAVTSGLSWLVFTWAGVPTDNPWIWLVSFALPFLVSYPVLQVLARLRTAHDAREKERLGLA